MSRVLVVDDEPDIRLLMRVTLQTAGHTVLEAGDGQAALESIRSDSFDLVLLDLRMPIVDGWAVLASLSEEGRTPDLPVIAISAHADPEMMQRALECGCRAYLSKPFKPDALRQVVDSTLG